MVFLRTGWRWWRNLLFYTFLDTSMNYFLFVSRPNPTTEFWMPAGILTDWHSGYIWCWECWDFHDFVTFRALFAENPENVFGGGFGLSPRSIQFPLDDLWYIACAPENSSENSICFSLPCEFVATLRGSCLRWRIAPASTPWSSAPGSAQWSRCSEIWSHSRVYGIGVHGLARDFWGFWWFLGISPLPNAIHCPSGLALGRKVMTVEYYQLAICVAAEAVSANKVPEEFFKHRADAIWLKLGCTPSYGNFLIRKMRLASTGMGEPQFWANPWYHIVGEDFFTMRYPYCMSDFITSVCLIQIHHFGWLNPSLIVSCALYFTILAISPPRKTQIAEASKFKKLLKLLPVLELGSPPKNHQPCSVGRTWWLSSRVWRMCSGPSRWTVRKSQVPTGSFGVKHSIIGDAMENHNF